MNDFAIQFENISKKYNLGQISHGMLYKDIQSLWAKLIGKKDPNSPILSNKINSHIEFWALKNIQFKIKPGEIVGIIGRNGAGKSTLLKILSRITSPTSGKIHFKGRMGSLLEVGTGFHPDLSGRENIFLNGAILGMTKTEIRSKFEEIVDFSGIEKFIDTPVKRYSSGMYVRLAFAVAAHLEPEILVIDEVLAVGDIEFQKKCLGKMESVSQKSGRTILFVSHNMAAISKLCSRVIFLKEGKIQFDGEKQSGIDRYMKENEILLKSDLKDRNDRIGEGKLRFIETWTENYKNEKKDLFLSGDELIICARVEIVKRAGGRNVTAAFQIQDSNDFVVTDINSKSIAKEFELPSTNEFIFRAKIPKLPLTQGSYNYHLIVWQDGVIEDFVTTGGAFFVENGDFFGTGRTVDKGHGVILINQEWEVLKN